MFLIFLFSTIFILLPSFFISYSRFERSPYKKITNSSYWKVRFNTGLFGEYSIVNELEKFPGIHKTLVNVYIPKENCSELTEIDILFIHEKGIYVIESKNYSGWIFGREKDYKWTQVFPNKKNFKFYNPIKQNHTHIKALQKIINDQPKELFTSMIVFSNRCTLKTIEVTTPTIHVINRRNLAIIDNINQHYLEKRIPVYSLYGKLSKYTNVSEKLKNEHVSSIQRKFS
ncbi:nuclease-related domain-containing protein [Rummeliibacillus sp. JY-2-4R]